MKTKQALLAKQAEELAAFEKEQSIIEALPEAFREDALICIHRNFVSVKLWNDFRTSKKLTDALAIVELFKGSIVQGEHWKSGCVSTWPAEINSTIKDENAVMDGSHEIEIHVSGGKEYGPSVAIKFWTRLAGSLAEISLPVCDLWKLVPRVNATYNNSGQVCKCEITWPVESRTCDSFRKFWSDKPSYSGSYYFADWHNFQSFIGAFLPKEAEAA